MWCVVCGVWCVVCGVWCVVRGVRWYYLHVGCDLVEGDVLVRLDLLELLVSGIGRQAGRHAGSAGRQGYVRIR